jgi:hypothetical protein
MPLDGLRAWIGEVERKLGMRTRVFLALATIAIGGAGAAIYLAIDTRDNAVSESDVQELQQRLEGQAGSGSVATDPKVIQLETELNALQAEVDRLESDEGDQGGNGVDGGAGTSGDGGAATGDCAICSRRPRKRTKRPKKPNRHFVPIRTVLGAVVPPLG